MATVVNGNQIKLNDGRTITAQTGGWYDGQQFWGGTLSNPGVINSQSNQQGAGQAVSNEVIAQTNPNNVAYIEQRRQETNTPAPTATPTVAPRTTAGAGAAGAGTGMPALGAPPTIDLNAITNAAYNSPEILAANKAITGLNEQVNARQQALTKATMDINDNPFYSEATRVGKIRALSEQANMDMSNLSTQQQQAQTQLATLKADAAIKVNAATGQYNIDNDAYKQTLATFNALVAAGGLANASANDLANYSVMTGIPVNMLQGIQQTQADKNSKVELITSTDNSGNVTITAVDANTGQIIRSSTAGQVGKANTGTASERKEDTQAQVQSYAVTDAKAGKTLQDMVNYYGVAGGLSIDEIYRIYNSNTPNGPAKETLEQVKQGIFANQRGFRPG